MKATIYFDGGPEDRQKFQAQCERSTSALRELGICPGKVVALLLHNEPLLLELMLA